MSDSGKMVGRPLDDYHPPDESEVVRLFKLLEDAVEKQGTREGREGDSQPMPVIYDDCRKCDGTGRGYCEACVGYIRAHVCDEYGNSPPCTDCHGTGKGSDVQSAVIADILKRREVGINRYGTPLQPYNGRNALLDAYEEVLDLACYLKQKLIEEGMV